MLIPNNFTITEAFVDELVAYTQNLPGDPQERAYLDYFAIYGTAFKSDIGSVASNAVHSHAVIHFKQDKVTSNIEDHRAYMNAFEYALVDKHGLPCRGFYNYFDEDIGCATTEDEVLAALYSDPARVKEIVRNRDPTGVFFRLFLQRAE